MRRFAITAALVCLVGQLSAQNINQSVQVTNEYETKFADFQKQGMEMSVPDSLYEFDYDFDYSVFETPYKGSYEFSPYMIKMTPEARAYDGKKLYLRAGAGYSLHPVLDFVYTPLDRKNLNLSIFNEGKGYSGSSFYDFEDSFGAGGRLILKNNTLKYKAGYDGIFAGSGSSGSSYNSLYAEAGLASAAHAENYLHYDLGLKYRYAADKYSVSNAGQHLVRLGGNVGPVIDGGLGFLMDFSFDVLSGAANMAQFTPKFTYTWGVFDFSAGVRLDYMDLSSNKLSVAPAVKASADLLGGMMKAELGAVGGRNLNDYHSLKTLNHFYTAATMTPMASREKINAYLALKGHVGSAVQYAVKGGYSVASSVAMDAMYGIGFADLSKAYVGADVKWVSERIELDALVNYAYNVVSGSSSVFVPSALTADVRFTYNWLRRIYAGASLDFASVRKSMGTADDIPAYADLALLGEWRMNSKWSVWAKAGNLLGMSIQRVPGYVEKGPYLTVGIGLSL